MTDPIEVLREAAHVRADTLDAALAAVVRLRDAARQVTYGASGHTYGQPEDLTQLADALAPFAQEER